VKQIKGSFKIVLALLIVFFFIQSEGFAQGQEAASAATPNPIPTPQQRDSLLAKMDAIDISLLTVGPGNEVWSLYGHTALRYQDKNRRQDLAINYGAFNFEQDYFLLRFVFGATDYEMETIPMRLFMDVYQAEGRWVREQQLNLTREEKLSITNALYKNSLPENVTYRYNFFYDNCTTRARNMIVQHLNISGYSADNHWNGESYRTMIHQWTGNHRWTRFGNDLLLGIQADSKTTIRQQEFLPDNLLYDFDHAQIYTNGQYRPLVKERRIVVPAGVQMVKSGFPLTPRQCGYILLVIGIVLTAVQWFMRRTFVLWDGVLMVVSGIIGFMLFLMLFSQHPTVQLNLQILLFNPLHLIYLWPVIKGRQTRYWMICTVMVALFLTGSLFQCYAEGLYTLALCLLLQSILHLLMRKTNE
jgi:hypothetical protein